MYLSLDLARSLKKKWLPQTWHGRWYCIDGNSLDETLYDHQDIADLNRAVEWLEFVYAPIFEELFEYIPNWVTIRIQKGVNGAIRFLYPDTHDHEYMMSPVDSLGMYIKVLLKNWVITF